MPRKKKGEKELKESLFDLVSIEIKKSVAAILLIGVAAILILANFGKAGPMGNFTYTGLSTLFGWGYYLLPIITLVIALVFLLTREIKFLSPTFLGALLLTLSALGLIDIIFPNKAGLVGNMLGLIEAPFGHIAALVIMAVLVIASLIVTINVPIQIKRKPKEDQLDIKEPESAVSEPEKEIKENSPPIVSPEIKKGYSSEKTFNPTANDFVALKNYKAPPPSLLKSSVEKPTSGDLRINANIIKRTLASFGITVEMGEVNIGPKVTRYSLKPAEGVKLTRILALNQDLSLALAAHPLRIEAPIPGKSLVGIEVPNKTSAIVRLGSLINYPEFTKTSSLTFIIGRDVNGNPIATDIAKMPHLLISGTTGSGKSIAIHSLIISMLYKNSPETLRMVLIDPKRVELSVYNDIPHLISPVITNGKKAINVFRWATQEMEQRYETLLKAGVRDIQGYNANIKNKRMSYLMLIVDELADLMASHGREIEAAIVRLAQMSRATGIHLVLATQRPSVEVITGLIKANISSRIALQVASQIDSRTILDCSGAEKLLGGGDMLFISPKFSKPKRIQGAFISEEEVFKVTEFISNNNELPKHEQFGDNNSNLAIENFSTNQAEEKDELYDEAIETVRHSKKASASLLQRRLKVGYARAARLLDIMENDGLIGPSRGAKPREVYLDNPAFQNKSLSTPLNVENNERDVQDNSNYV